MARRRFFVDEVRRGEAELEGEEAEHLTRVLRVEMGQRFEISDGERLYLGEVIEARKRSVRFRVVESLEVEDFDLQGEGLGYFALGIPRRHAEAAQNTAELWNKVRTSWQSLTGQRYSIRKFLDVGPGILRVLLRRKGSSNLKPQE